MNIDWSRVKKQTLWSYEDLIAKLQGVLSYGFVQEYYHHTMKQAQGYARQIRRGYLQDHGDKVAFIDNMVANLEMLKSIGIGNYPELIEQTATREQCQEFLQRTHFDFDALIQTLNYLMRWVLPFKTPVREFIHVDQPDDLKYLEALNQRRIGSNLDLLELGRVKAGRDLLAKETTIPLVYIASLVHKADISRLAYVRGKTVEHLSGGGYDTLEKIAAASLEEMEAKMDVYYKSLGKSLTDFKLVIPLSWMIGGAQVLPRVVEE